jgi:hypothetical protein
MTAGTHDTYLDVLCRRMIGLQFRAPPNLIPTTSHTLRLPPPISSAGGADVRWRTVRNGPAYQLGAISCHPSHCCRRPCEAWLRHDAKMLVTPRGTGCNLRNGGGQDGAHVWGGEGRIPNDKSDGPDPPRSPFYSLGRKRCEVIALGFFPILSGNARPQPNHHVIPAFMRSMTSS